MRFPFMINPLFILSLTASTSNPELILPVNDDSIFQDTSQIDLSPSSSFDQPTSLFDQAELPEDLDFSAVSNPSESLFQETSSSSSLSDKDSFSLSPLSSSSNDDDDDEIILNNNPFDIANDCSPSTHLLSLPPIGKKSRIIGRRPDDSSGLCKSSNEATGTPSSSFSSSESSGSSASDPSDLSHVKAIFKDTLAMLWLTADMADSERRNRFCHWLTSGLLPIGVCSSGSADDQSISIFQQLQLPAFSQFGGFGLWQLRHGTLGMFFF